MGRIIKLVVLSVIYIVICYLVYYFKPMDKAKKELRVSIKLSLAIIGVEGIAELLAFLLR